MRNRFVRNAVGIWLMLTSFPPAHEANQHGCNDTQEILLSMWFVEAQTALP
jgi:hypothetical protein